METAHLTVIDGPSIRINFAGSPKIKVSFVGGGAVTLKSQAGPVIRLTTQAPALLRFNIGKNLTLFDTSFANLTGSPEDNLALIAYLNQFDGVSVWSELAGKPFELLSDDFLVGIDGKLKLKNSNAPVSAWGDLTEKPFSTLSNLFSVSPEGVLTLANSCHDINWLPSWGEISAKPIWTEKFGWDGASVTVSTDMHITGKLVVDGTIQLFGAGAGGTGGGGSTTLWGLTDVADDVANAVYGDLIMYNGTHFARINQSVLALVHTHPYRLDTWVPTWEEVASKPEWLSRMSWDGLSTVVSSDLHVTGKLVVDGTIQFFGSGATGGGGGGASALWQLTDVADEMEFSINGDIPLYNGTHFTRYNISNLSLYGHLHSIAQVTGLQGTLDEKQPLLGYTPYYASNFVAGVNYSAPHSHPYLSDVDARIANWTTAFNWGNHAGLYRPIGYVPSWGEISSKPTWTDKMGWDGAAVTVAGDLHVIGKIISDGSMQFYGISSGGTGGGGSTTLWGLSDVADDVQNAVVGDLIMYNGTHFARINQSILAPAVHFHTIAQVTGLQSALDGKQASGSYVLTSDGRLSDSRVASDVYGWAKASMKPSYTKSEVGLNLADNTADSTKSVSYAANAGNSSLWGGILNGFAQGAYTNSLANLIGQHSNGNAYIFNLSAVQTWLGLGSNAYNSIAYLPLAGGTLLGALNGTSATFSNSLSATTIITNGLFQSDSDYYFYNKGYSALRNISVSGVYASQLNGANGLNITGNGGFFNSANKFGLDNNAGTTRFYFSGPDVNTRGLVEFHASNSSGTSDNIIFHTTVYDENIFSGSVMSPKFGPGTDPFDAFLSRRTIGANIWRDPSYNFRTLGTHGSYGYSGIEFAWGGINFFATNGQSTVADAIVTPINVMVLGYSGLTVNGNITATGNIIGLGTMQFYTASDRRLKKDFEAITNPVEKIKSLTGYFFNYTDQAMQLGGYTSRRDIGLIAQDVNAILPEACGTLWNTDFMGYKADKLIPLLVEAIKQQQTEIDQLKRQIAA